MLLLVLAWLYRFSPPFPSPSWSSSRIWSRQRPQQGDQKDVSRLIILVNTVRLGVSRLLQPKKRYHALFYDQTVHIWAKLPELFDSPFGLPLCEIVKRNILVAWLSALVWTPRYNSNQDILGAPLFSQGPSGVTWEQMWNLWNSWYNSNSFNFPSVNKLDKFPSLNSSPLQVSFLGWRVQNEDSWSRT